MSFLRIVGYILEVYVFVLIATALLSWVRPAYDSPIRKLQQVLAAITEPVLAPVRRILPTARVGGVGFDFSIMIVILVIQLVVIPLVLS
ncbi:MAG: YggT family protein [Acidimicrobiales bacterium]|jgi:YggT family protein